MKSPPMDKGILCQEEGGEIDHECRRSIFPVIQPFPRGQIIPAPKDLCHVS